MDRKIKILYIHHGSGIGGAPISLLNLVKGIDASRYDVKVAFLQNSAVVELFNKAGICTEVLNAPKRYFSHNISDKTKFRHFFRYFGIIVDWIRTVLNYGPKYLRCQNVDIVHLNSHALTSWAVAAKRLNLFVVMHNREAVSSGYLGIRLGILRRLIKKYVDYVINISWDNSRRLGIPEKSLVVFNFLDVPNDFKKPMHESECRKILYMGGQAKMKGFETMVNALTYLENNIIVYFAGSYGSVRRGSDFMSLLKEKIKLVLYRNQYGLLRKLFNSKNATIIGLVENPLKIIDECDVLVTPFYYPHFSRPAIEAMMYGKPVVASNIEGMDEIIDDNVNGILVKKGDPFELAEAINQLCGNPELARKMGVNGREKAIRLYSPDVNIIKVEELYIKIINRDR